MKHIFLSDWYVVKRSSVVFFGSCIFFVPLVSFATISAEPVSLVGRFFDTHYEQLVLLFAFLSGLFVYPYFSGLGWWSKYLRKKKDSE
jgi:hypothetical protein